MACLVLAAQGDSSGSDMWHATCMPHASAHGPAHNSVHAMQLACLCCCYCCCCRPVPDPDKSSPVAIFVSSQPVPLSSSSSRAATADAAREAQADIRCRLPPGQDRPPTAHGRLEALMNGDTRGPADPPAPAPPKDIFTAACCNVQVLGCMPLGWPMDLDGDLLSYGYRTGYKQRDPALAGVVLRQDGEGGVAYTDENYQHGLFSGISCIHSDAGRAVRRCR